MSGKGDDRRKALIADETVAANWARIFGNKLVGNGVTGSMSGSNPEGSRSSLDSPATWYEELAEVPCVFINADTGE